MELLCSANIMFAEHNNIRCDVPERYFFSSYYAVEDIAFKFDAILLKGILHAVEAEIRVEHIPVSPDEYVAWYAAEGKKIAEQMEIRFGNPMAGFSFQIFHYEVFIPFIR